MNKEREEFIAALNETQRNILVEMKVLAKKSEPNCVDAEIFRQIALRNAAFLRDAPTLSTQRKKRGPYKVKRTIQ